MIERMFQSKLKVPLVLMSEIINEIPFKVDESYTYRFDLILQDTYLSYSFYYPIIQYNQISLFDILAPAEMTLLSVIDLAYFGKKEW